MVLNPVRAIFEDRPVPSLRLLATVLLASAVLATTTPVLASAPAPDDTHHAGSVPGEAAVLGADHARAHAGRRKAADAMREYPQSRRTAGLASLRASQRRLNAAFTASDSGRFTDYFPSPDFGVHVAQLPTGKVLLFSFERVEVNPTKETGPTDRLGRTNAGRAYLWDPAKGTGTTAFKKVPPPTVLMPDGTYAPRPAPFFCAGHSYLPNGMVGVFGGNGGGKGGTGARLSFVFDPWTETWFRNRDMMVGRWYPSVVTGADGRQLIMSGQDERGTGHPTPLVERFPARGYRVPWRPYEIPAGVPAERFAADAPFRNDYPHLFSLRDGMIYGLGRDADQQWVFDPVKETRTDLPRRPAGFRGYGSAVPLPAGLRGPDSVLVLGGDPLDPSTYRLSGGAWRTDTPRAFGRTQDDTLILPDATLLTVNGALDTRNYGYGPFNPKADLKYRQVELRDAQGHWKLGPAQRLPRGYHSNALVMPDGRVMVTGDELQQIANDPDIADGMDGSIELYEPPYLHRGPRPALDRAPRGELAYDAQFQVRTSTPADVARAVLLAPTTVTHAVNTSQRHLELPLTATGGDTLTLHTPPSAADAPPGYYMLFLLSARGVPSTAQWIKLGPRPRSR
ncbi:MULTISPECIES: galactose oxidase early set domain-containing protein [unclassified Streptomyces]|uniref:galactose oxidase early set domain-containing protein n=1 Tax=unclassified Streptomyces TaxID=2593676 RepID=UPI002E2F617F|nr:MULTISPECIES: galactose oxidase early set domain-containing protein [unclassified Streptomyces]WUC67795.1 galactose oxidase early set domain-containing protein [Streptomyces sp. NBC_00539]